MPSCSPQLVLQYKYTPATSMCSRDRWVVGSNRSVHLLVLQYECTLKAKMIV